MLPAAGGDLAVPLNKLDIKVGVPLPQICADFH
jgi:hypothetical protein